MPTNAAPRRAIKSAAAEFEATSPSRSRTPAPRRHSSFSPEVDLEAELRAACWLDRGILAGLGILAVVGIFFLAYALRLVDRSWGIMFELVRYALS